jgi:Flp pilus assembly protein protease CpaA
MDIPLFFAVLRRFKWIVLGGLVLGIALAVLSYGRGSVTYESQAEALITQQSFPYGRAAAPGGANPAAAVQVGNSAVLSGLSPVYAQLANSDQIIHSVHKLARVPGTITASEVSDLASGANLPFVQLVSTSPTAAGAVTLTQTEFNVLSRYIAQQQAAAGISPNDRVQLILIQSGNPPKLASGHSSSIPMLVFVAVLGAAIAVAFIREKADPRTAAALGRVPAEQPHLAQDALHANGMAANGNDYGAEPNIHLVPGAGAGAGPKVGVAPGGPNVQAAAARPQASRSVKERLIAPPRPGSSFGSKSDA